MTSYLLKFQKENPTDDDIAKLKKYHTAFLQKLGEFEEMTRNVEKLMGMSDIPTSQLDMRMSGPPVTKPPKPVSSMLRSCKSMYE